MVVEHSLTLSFSTSNNQAEYEAILAGLRLAEDLGAREVHIFTDSQLVASQVQGGYQAKNNSLIEYLKLVKEYMKKFDRAEISHVSRKQNTRADILSKLTSTRKKGRNRSVIQESLSRPSIEKTSTPPKVNAIGDSSCWMTPVFNFLTRGGSLRPNRSSRDQTTSMILRGDRAQTISQGIFYPTLEVRRRIHSPRGVRGNTRRY